MCAFQILRSLPFLANVEDELFDEIVAAGQLVTYRAGDEIWEPPPDAADQASCVPCSRKLTMFLAPMRGFVILRFAANSFH